MCGQLSTTCINATKVTQWGTPSCSRPQPATDNIFRDDRSNWLAVTPHPTQGTTAWSSRVARCKCGLQNAILASARRREHVTFRMPGQRTASAATQCELFKRKWAGQQLLECSQLLLKCRSATVEMQVLNCGSTACQKLFNCRLVTIYCWSVAGQLPS